MWVECDVENMERCMKKMGPGGECLQLRDERKCKTWYGREHGGETTELGTQTEDEEKDTS